MDFLFHFAHFDLFRADFAQWQNALVFFWALVLAHALADFPLQGEFLAVGKDRHADLGCVTGGKDWPRNIWLYCLTIHSFVHSALVWLVSGSVILSLVEFVLHWLIDLAKNERLTGFYSDQALHIACKVVYAWLFFKGITWP